MINTSQEIFVGSKQLQVHDEENNLSFNLLLEYPCYQVSSPIKFGPYTMDVSPDAKICEGQFPLIIISHGNGGSHLIYRSISTYLAKRGYIVAMIEHYGNNRNNNELEYTIRNLQYRPRHVSLSIDYLLSQPLFGEHISKDKIVIIGHSMGGYTALALAGGIPHTEEGIKVEVNKDDRIKALVLLAPAAGWFKHSMHDVNIPVVLYMAEHDIFTPAWNADIIKNGILDKSLVNHHEIKNAGHYSFITPFPEAMKNQNFPPSTDPDDFDREAFHQILPKEIFEFLNEKL